MIIDLKVIISQKRKKRQCKISSVYKISKLMKIKKMMMGGRDEKI